MNTKGSLARVLAVTALFGLAGCYPPPRLNSLIPSPEPVSNYALGETRIAAPGSVMVDRTDGSHLLPGFVLVGPLTVRGTSEQPPAEAGLWVARFQYGGACPNPSYVLTNPWFYQERVGIVVSEDGTIECNPPVVQLIGGKKGRTWEIEEPLPSQPFSPVPYIAGFAAEAVRWQLLYGGRAGNTLTLEYREFRDGAYHDSATPVYQQQLKYDLGATKTIAFRDTQIQVVSANSREITFRVLRDAGPAIRMPDPMLPAPESDGPPY